jgi:hypothetical protein
MLVVEEVVEILEVQLLLLVLEVLVVDLLVFPVEVPQLAQ